MMILTVVENAVLVKLVHPFSQILTTVVLKRHKENKAVSFKRNGLLTSNGCHFVQHIMWCFATIVVA